MSRRRHGRAPDAAADARGIAGWFVFAGVAAALTVWLGGSGLPAGLAILACALALAAAAYALVRWRVFALPTRPEPPAADTPCDEPERGS